MTLAINPEGASGEGNVVNVDSFAFAIDDLVSFVASFANAFLKIELLASSLNFATYSVFIKVVSVRAFDTRVAAPDSASEIIIELC